MIQVDPVLASQRDSATHQLRNGGFIADEAKKMLEFCVELNDQDSYYATKNPTFRGDLSGWDPIYDSRDGLGDDPADNGFGAFENAWFLYRNRSRPDQYVAAIRGTIGEARSILDDALATTIAANSGIEFPKNRILPVVFASTPHAEVHLGFALGAFTLLFDKNRGMLKAFADRLPVGAQLLITGHSQGAAIAVLVHAFLHYALTDPNDRYGLRAKAYCLKSYVFALPKPGNYEFAFDFAQIAGRHGAAFTLNNNLDPITLVPLSRETAAEAISVTLEENQTHQKDLKSVLLKGADDLADAVRKLRNEVAELVADKTAKLYHKDEMTNIETSYFDNVSELPDTPVSSLNYSFCGNLIPLFGLFKGGDLYPRQNPDEPDLLLQHHATTYRILVQDQIN